MSKIFQLSLIGRNYNLNLGAYLQAYALNRTIARLSGKNPTFIDYIPNSPNSSSGISNALRRLPVKIQREGLHETVQSIKQYSPIILTQYINRIDGTTKHRMKCFSRFQREYIPLTEKTYRNIEELARDFGGASEDTLFIVGSDLVWSPRYNSKYPERLKVYLLSFTSKGIKASYAASVGDPIPPSLRELYKKHLREFNYISVREKSSAKYLREILPNTDIEVVLDPTALLSKEEWIEIAVPPSKTPSKPYILVYDIHVPNLIPRIRKFARQHDLSIVTYSQSILRKNESFYPYGPQEFIWLVNNAEFVITTSFHGTIFAVLFEKPFISINPEPYAPVTRIKDLLNLIGAQHQLVPNVKHISWDRFEEVDWNYVSSNLNKQKRHSLGFIKKVLREARI